MLLSFTNSSLMEFQVKYSDLFRLFSVLDAFELFWWMWSLYKNIQLMLELLKTTSFLYYKLTIFLMMLFVIFLYVLLVLLFAPGEIWFLICGNSYSRSWIFLMKNATNPVYRLEFFGGKITVFCSFNFLKFLWNTLHVGSGLNISKYYCRIIDKCI